MSFKAIAFLILLFCSFTGRAQSLQKIDTGIKPYLVTIKTQHQAYKGLFLKIDSQKVLIYNDEQYTEIPTAEVKSMKFRVVKSNYQLKSYILKYSDNTEYNYINSRGKRVDKWGREEPTANEAFAALVFGVFGELVANGVAGAIHNINPSIANYKFRKGFDMKQLNALTYYSVYYQQHPDTFAELKKLKELSADFKP